MREVRLARPQAQHQEGLTRHSRALLRLIQLTVDAMSEAPADGG